MNKILALWAVPRSRSTAFTVMMEHRGDFSIHMEPFEMSAYYSDERIFNRYPSMGSHYNYSNALKELLTAAEKNTLFIKDHAYYILNIADRKFLSYFQHTFLIRDPAYALPSYFNIWPDVSIKETGYKELSELFDKVVDYTGNVPPLIDADDLIKNPQATVKAYCEQVGIPYIANALKWKQNFKHSRIVSTFGIWHDHLVTTSGFEEGPRRAYLKIDENQQLKQLYDECVPYYKKLYEKRIRVDLS